MTERWIIHSTWLALAAVVALSGCGEIAGQTDRAGNPVPPVTVTLATDELPETMAGQLVNQFADEVTRLSDGAVKVDVTYGAAGGGVAWDQKVITKVANGDFDLVIARAGAWHTSGVTSLDVLELPGLINTDAQADRVVSNTVLVDELLAGLATTGFTGLGLYPEAPRYLMLLDGSERFDVSALQGRTVRTPQSETVSGVLRALGMRPVDLTFDDFTVEVTEGRVTATEGHLARVSVTTTADSDTGVVVAANLPLYTKFLVLAARSDAVDEATLAVLQAAGRAIVEPFNDMRARETDSAAAACQAGGRLIQVNADDRAALLAATQPVIDEFTSGPDAALLPLVRAGAGAGVTTPWTCGPAKPSASNSPGESPGEPLPLALPTKRSDIVPTPGDLPDGVYRFTETLEALQAAGLPTEEAGYIGEFVLRGGTAEIHYFNPDGSPEAGEPPDTGGVYQVQGDLMIFATPPERAIPGTSGIVLLHWALEGDTLTLEQIDNGRRDSDFAVPWLRVGDAP